MTDLELAKTQKIRKRKGDCGAGFEQVWELGQVEIGLKIWQEQVYL